MLLLSTTTRRVVVGSRACARRQVFRQATTTTTPQRSLMMYARVGRRTATSKWSPPHRPRAAVCWYSPSRTTTLLAKEEEISSSSYPPHTLFPMPALSPTMESGTIASWALNEGDAFGAGDVLCSIETDKAAVDFEAQDDGVLAKILTPVGVDLPVGTPICVVTEDADDVPAFAHYTVAGGGGEAPAAAAEPVPAAPAATSTTSATTTAAPATLGTPSLLLPSARHLAESKGLDATVLAGSGKGGRVTKGDVLQALASGVALPPLAKRTAAAPSVATTPPPAAAAAAPAAPKMTLADMLVSPAAMTLESAYEDVANNKMRQIIAKRLTESKATVPHFYTTTDVQLDAVLALRKQWASQLDLKVSVNDFILKASALALRDVPQVNATFDTKSDQVTPSNAVDISVAVATPTGLITPIVFGADQIGLTELTNTVQDLAKRARDGKLAPHEYQGGTFSVSNLGMFGIAEFSAVINPPQAAILAVGAGSPTVCLPGPVTRTVMQARLSADRRVVDEPTAALFCQALREYLQDPESLLL